MKARGFTLVELVTVIMITGILAAALTIFLKPAVDSYFAARRRADLTDMADTALRRMSQDIRRAVPNSIVTSSPLCFGLVPTTTGGRYRAGPDTVNDVPPMPCVASATCSAPLDTTQATTVFDVLSPLPVSPPAVSPLSATPAVGDFVVIDNVENGIGGEVYVGTNRAAIAKVEVPRTTDGLARISVAATQFHDSPGERFVVVSQKEQVVYYNCVGTTLYRTVALFSDVPTTACARTDGAVVATDVANVGGAPACTFVYNPGPSFTQQSGFVATSLTLSRDGESVILFHGTHVDNVP